MTNTQPHSSLILYGIKNCDTVRKARRYLDEQQIAYRFHDYRVDGADAALLHSFVQTLGADILINKRGTTWRNLPEEVRLQVTDNDSAVSLMQAHPAVIKRPLLADANGKMLCGFSATTYQTFLQENL